MVVTMDCNCVDTSLKKELSIYKGNIDVNMLLRKL